MIHRCCCEEFLLLFTGAQWFELHYFGTHGSGLLNILSISVQVHYHDIRASSGSEQICFIILSTYEAVAYIKPITYEFKKRVTYCEDCVDFWLNKDLV